MPQCWNRGRRYLPLRRIIRKSWQWRRRRGRWKVCRKCAQKFLRHGVVGSEALCSHHFAGFRIKQFWSYLAQPSSHDDFAHDVCLVGANYNAMSDKHILCIKCDDACAVLPQVVPCRFAHLGQRLASDWSSCRIFGVRSGGMDHCCRKIFAAQAAAPPCRSRINPLRSRCRGVPARCR